jgi:hypothetical protein
MDNTIGFMDIVKIYKEFILFAILIVVIIFFILNKDKYIPNTEYFNKLNLLQNFKIIIVIMGIIFFSNYMLIKSNQMTMETLNFIMMNVSIVFSFLAIYFTLN